MGPDEVIDGRAGGGLSALVEPEPRNHPRIVRAPDTWNEARLGGCRHDAGRGPHDVGKTTVHIDRLTGLPPPADRAHASGVSVNQRRGDRRTFEESEIICRGLRQAGTQRRAGRDDLRSDFRVIIEGQVAKTNALEIAAAPALIVGEIIPFADDRAYRAVDPVARNER